MQRLLSAAGLAVIALSFSSPAIAQDEKNSDTLNEKKLPLEEIIIRPKTDKDSKVTIEIHDGQILVNGKAVSDFEDGNFTIRKLKIHPGEDGDVYSLTGPSSPFRVWDFNSDEGNLVKTMTEKRAFLGVSTVEAEGGVRIDEVTEGSAAEKMGLKKGDIIKKVNDAVIESPDQLTRTIKKSKPNDNVVVGFQREGKDQQVSGHLGETPGFSIRYNNKALKRLAPMSPSPDYNYFYNYSYNGNGERPRIGLKAQDTEDGKGVKVLEVDEESAAEKAGLREGDVITEFDGKAVNSTEALAGLAREARAHGKNSIAVKFSREGKVQTAEIKIPHKLRTEDL